MLLFHKSQQNERQKMIYAIRHGQTDWNQKGIIQGGGSDCPLNSQGIQQAALLAEKLKKFNITKIYSSDLLRAKQTTEEINKILKVEVFYSPLLRETNYGEVEGKDEVDINKIEKYMKICNAIDAGDNNAHFPGGESRNMVVNRFIRFLQQIKDNTNILISSHGGILRSVSCLYGGEDKKIPNCGGISFSLDEKHRPQNILFFE